MTQSDAAAAQRNDQPTVPERIGYPVSEVATMLAVSRAHVYRLIESGQLGAIDVSIEGSTRTKYRVRQLDLDAYLAS